VLDAVLAPTQDDDMTWTNRIFLLALMAVAGLIGSACGGSDTEPAAERASSADVDQVVEWIFDGDVLPEGLTADDARCVAEQVVNEMPDGTDFAAAIEESESTDDMTDFDMAGMDAMFDCLGGNRIALMMFTELGADDDQAQCMAEAIGDDLQNIFEIAALSDSEPETEVEMDAAFALMDAGLECGLG
jgi:hypothetical protein